MEFVALFFLGHLHKCWKWQKQELCSKLTFFSDPLLVTLRLTLVSHILIVKLRKKVKTPNTKMTQEDTEVTRTMLWIIGTPNAGNKFVGVARRGDVFFATSNLGYGGLWNSTSASNSYVYRSAFVQRTNMLMGDWANDQFQIRWRVHLEMEARHEATNLCYLSLSPASINEPPPPIVHPPTYPSISPCVSLANLRCLKMLQKLVT